MTVYLPPTRRAMGAVDWQQIVDSLVTNSKVIDPDLPEVASLVREVIVFERRPGGLLDPARPSTFRIADLRRPLRGYLFFRRHPWVAYAIPGAALALAFALGRATR